MFVGHDWGSMVVWQLALLHAGARRRCRRHERAVPPARPDAAHPAHAPAVRRRFFYILYFQEPGVADADLGARPGDDDAPHARRPDACREDGASDVARPRRTRRPRLRRPAPRARRPARLADQAELDHYVAEFTRTGFTGGINWYRNFDRNWELTPTLDGAKVDGARRCSSAAPRTRCCSMSPPVGDGRLRAPTTAATCSSRAPATGCSRRRPARSTPRCSTFLGQLELTTSRLASGAPTARGERGQADARDPAGCAFDGAVDADGHILEPPDLWETLPRAAVPRPGAARSCSTSTASRSSRSAAQRSMMSREGFPSTLGAMGDPDLARDADATPSAPTSARRRTAAWIPSERLEVLDAEGIDAVVLYTTVGLLWEAELDDAELSQAYTRAYNRWICEFCAGQPAARPDRAPLADAIRPRPPRSSSGPSARAPRARTSRRSPTTAGRSATPTTTRCSPPRRTSTCRSRSIRRSSRSGRRARAWARGRTSSSCGCWRR